MKLMQWWSVLIFSLSAIVPMRAWPADAGLIEELEHDGSLHAIECVTFPVTHAQALKVGEETATTAMRLNNAVKQDFLSAALSGEGIVKVKITCPTHSGRRTDYYIVERGVITKVQDLRQSSGEVRQKVLPARQVELQFVDDAIPNVYATRPIDGTPPQDKWLVIQLSPNDDQF